MTADPAIKLLLVEDTPADAELVHRALEKETAPPFEVEWCDRLARGLDRLTQGDIQVVVLDLSLPDSHGLVTFTKVKTQAPEVPVVILTGSFEEDAIALEAMKQGAQDFLTKDRLSGPVLSRAVRYAIERKKVELELGAVNRELKLRLDNIAWLNQIVEGFEKTSLDLKKEVDALLKELGRPPKYRL